MHCVFVVQLIAWHWPLRHDWEHCCIVCFVVFDEQNDCGVPGLLQIKEVIFLAMLLLLEQKLFEFTVCPQSRLEKQFICI